MGKMYFTATAKTSAILPTNSYYNWGGLSPSTFSINPKPRVSSNYSNFEGYEDRFASKNKKP